MFRRINNTDSCLTVWEVVQVACTQHVQYSTTFHFTLEAISSSNAGRNVALKGPGRGGPIWGTEALSSDSTELITCRMHCRWLVSSSELRLLPLASLKRALYFLFKGFRNTYYERVRGRSSLLVTIYFNCASYGAFVTTTNKTCNN